MVAVGGFDTRFEKNFGGGPMMSPRGSSSDEMSIGVGAGEGVAGMDPFGDDDDDDDDGGAAGSVTLLVGPDGRSMYRRRIAKQNKVSAEEALGDLLGDYGEIDRMKSEALEREAHGDDDDVFFNEEEGEVEEEEGDQAEEDVTAPV